MRLPLLMCCLVAALANDPGQSTTTVTLASTTSGTTVTGASTTSGTAVTPASTTSGTAVTPASTTSGTTVTSASTTSGTAVPPASTTTGTTVTSASTTSGTAVPPASTTSSTAVTGASTTSGTAVTSASTTSGTTVTSASTTSGTTVTGASTTSGTAVTGASTTSGTTVTSASTTSGTAVTPASTTSGTTVTSASTTSGTTGTPGSTTSGTTGTPGSTTSGTTGTPASTTSGTTGSTASTISTTIATTIKGPCSPNPCIGNGVCEERHGGSFVCICQAGLNYDETLGCVPAKVFPGNLVLNGDFQEKMSDRKSEVFKQTAEKIQSELKKVLKGNGYVGSIVLSLRRGSVVAEVQNFYHVSSNATTESVGKQIATAIANDQIENANSFEGRTVCDAGFCDANTTTCEGDGTAVCTCREGYIKSQFSTQSCISCPDGHQAVGSDHCKKCNFGFSGFNCKNPYLLVVIVVSCVLGSLLIIFIVALIIVCSRKPKKTSSSKDDFSPYGNMELHKPAGVPRIPRANPNSQWEPANLELTNSGSTEALVTKSKSRLTNYDDDNNGMGYKNDSPVYSGVRGVENGSRSAQNPYFRQDEDRMRRY